MGWFGEHIVEILSVIVTSILSLYIARVAILQNRRITSIEENRQKHVNFVFFKIEMDDNRIMTGELNGQITRSYARGKENAGYGEIELTACPTAKLDKVSLNLKNVGNTHAETFEVLEFEMLHFNPVTGQQTKYVPAVDGEIFKRSYVLKDEHRYVHIAVKDTETSASDKKTIIEAFSITMKVRYTDVTVGHAFTEGIKFSGTLEGFEHENASAGIPSDREKLKMVFDSSAVTYSAPELN